MIKQSTIRFLFLMIYFSNFWNTFIANYYLNLSLYQNVNQIFFYVIMTVLKIICPTLSGFIIDHVQFNLNILFIGQWLTIVSYIYFLANIYQEIDDYIYFAIGFQILGQQLQIIIILTMISKHFNENEIPLQIAKFYQFECGGRLLCTMIFFLQAIFTVQENRLKYEKNIQLILSMIPFIILISLAICIYKSFSIFRFDIYQKIPELQYIPIKSRSNLLQAMKDVCKTDVILIAISATSVMSIIQIWQQYQLDYCFDEYKINNPQEIWIIFVAFAISEFPIFISVFIAYRLGKKIKNEIDALQYLTTATSSSLVYFILSTLQLICYKSLFSLRLFITILTITMQQYNQTILSISSTILIGIQKNNQRSLGLSFGILSMSTNIFQIWVISVLSKFRQKQQQYFYEKMAVIYGFAICYTILGATLAKMLQFIAIMKINQSTLNFDKIKRLNT